MAAAMNGMALHGGIIPYGGTFLVFTDYCRPSIRLAALMGLRVIYVMTHDSIGLGEDGPTHQPVEHLAALRAIPNLQVLRPADTIETAECWQLALECEEDADRPRADAPEPAAAARRPRDGNLCARGGYSWPATAARASHAGRHRARKSQLALEARDLLARTGVPPRRLDAVLGVVRRAGRSYRQQVLGGDGTGAGRLSRPPSGFGWERWLGARRRLRRHDRASARRPRQATSISISASRAEAIAAADSSATARHD